MSPQKAGYCNQFCAHQQVDELTQSGLSLTLFVARIRTNYANHTLTADNLAFIANFLNRSANFHDLSPNFQRPAKALNIVLKFNDSEL